MNQDSNKILWLIGDVIGMVLIFEVSNYFIGIVFPYLLFQGAYFRGKNWFIGWKRVKETKQTL